MENQFGRRKSWSDGTTTKNYWYDNLNLLSDGASTFLNGVGIDEPLQLANGSNVRSHLKDIRGSVSRLVNASSGAAVSQNFYTAYGKLENNASNPAPNPFTYTAREDDANGLMYYRARYYDPKLEMFISQDPFGNAQRYVQGKPIIFTDPLG